MKAFVLAALAFAPALVVPNSSKADDAADRAEAISICRAEVQAQVGPDTKVRFDQVRSGANVVRVDFDVWRDGALQNVRCDVQRGPELVIASITPPLRSVAQAR